jgi:hypothetical protein
MKRENEFHTTLLTDSLWLYQRVFFFVLLSAIIRVVSFFHLLSFIFHYTDCLIVYESTKSYAMARVGERPGFS